MCVCPGMQRGRKPQLCVGEMGHILVLEAAARCPAMWHHVACWLLSPLLQPLTPCPMGEQKAMFLELLPLSKATMSSCAEVLEPNWLT